MIFTYTYDVMQLSAALAEMAEKANFSGNDVAAMRIGTFGDGDIENFVQMVAQAISDAEDRGRQEMRERLV